MEAMPPVPDESSSDPNQLVRPAREASSTMWVYRRLTSFSASFGAYSSKTLHRTLERPRGALFTTLATVSVTTPGLLSTPTFELAPYQVTQATASVLDASQGPN